MGIRTGKQYLSALRDDRVVYMDGERVTDVTSDPRFAAAAGTVAELLDIQHRPELLDTMTFKSPTSGERVGMSFLEPRTQEDLARRRKCLKTWADATYGMFGRSPDFMNVMLTGIATAHEMFDRDNRAYGDNVRKYYDLCRENDLVMTHVLVNPQVDRSKPVDKQDKDLAAKVVKEDDKGIYITGARMVSTLAAFSDEIMVMPSSYIQTGPDALDYAFGCALPVATPGMTYISRPAVLPYKAGSFLDYPLSYRLDESDAVVIFENVFVPWERVFMYRDPAMCNQLYMRTQAGGHTSTQSAVRALAKAEFMLALGLSLAKSTNITEHLHVQGMLAEMMLFVENIKALIVASEAQAKTSPWGTLVPEGMPLWVNRMNFPKMFIRCCEIIQLLGAGGLVAVPSNAEFGGDVKHLVEKYYQSANSDAQHRVRLFRLALDASMSTFSGRQQLYERYYTGDPVRLYGTFYNMYKKEPFYQRIDEVLEDMARRADEFDAPLDVAAPRAVSATAA
jgi:4-hydroxyphenylacetate 3-monooxygenase